jgi:hypothetical protein
MGREAYAFNLLEKCLWVSSFCERVGTLSVFLISIFVSRNHLFSLNVSKNLILYLKIQKELFYHILFVSLAI